jgi:tetratricopeptide (TPR) repeat protein
MLQATPRTVFLSYHSADADRVAAVRRSLIERGVSVFSDRHDLVAGLPWPQALEKALQSVQAVLVFVGDARGAEGLGFWQRREVWFALDRQAQEEGQGRSFPVVPILLPGSHAAAGFLFLNTWVDLRDATGHQGALDAIANAVAGVAAPPDLPKLSVLSPYRGLESFREEHAAVFFGREAFAAELIDRVLHRSLVALIGASGGGKSSVVQAGLLPLLRRQRPPQRAWDTVVLRPGDEPFHRLAASLVPLLEPDLDEVDRLASARKLGERLSDGSVLLSDVVCRLIVKSNGTDRVLIVVDQFEELFTSTPAPQRQCFVTTVLSALDRAPITLLLTLRADFYGQAIDLDRGLSDRIQSGLVNLGPMTREELRLAVGQPAALAQVRFEPGLVDRILAQVEAQPGSLPLLEFALTELWERREGRLITHAAFEAIGEVPGAISKRAEAVFLGLDASRKDAASRLFTRLVRAAAPGDSEPDTRRRVALDTLTESERGVLQPFVEARLLVLGWDEAASQTVEVAHEALIRGWRRFGAWVDQQREFLLWRQRLGQSMAEWNRTGRDAEALLRRPGLKEATGWVRDRQADLSQQELEFISISRGKQRWRRRWKQFAIALAIVPVVLLSVLALVARSDGFALRGAVYVAPELIPATNYAASASWIHAVDVAGRLDELGSTLFAFPPAANRLVALQQAALIMADEGRNAEAERLAQKALELAKEIPDFDFIELAQLNMADMLVGLGQVRSARPFAERGLALAQGIADVEARAFSLARVANTFAAAGFRSEAIDVIGAARRTLPATAPVITRTRLEVSLAPALVRVGAPDEVAAIMTPRSGLPLYLPLVQALIDRGRLADARALVDRFKDPMGTAIVASAFASRGSVDDAKFLTRNALALVDTHPGGPLLRDAIRLLVYKRLLLNLITPTEAVALVKEAGRPDDSASLALALAKLGRENLVRELCRDVMTDARATADGNMRARLLTKVAHALAEAGEAESALAAAREIDEREFHAVALAHAAYGFAVTGNEERTKALVGEVEEILPSIGDPLQRATLRFVLTMADVRLGHYARALQDDAREMLPAEKLSIYAAVIRDDALHRDGRLREAFDRGPTEFLGRVGLHLP